MALAPAEGRPLVLIVEDRTTNLTLRLRLFANAGFAPLGVTSANDALRELSASPLIDLVVTDINLDPSQEDDQSGIALAARVKSQFSQVPVVGYSAKFADWESSLQNQDVFDLKFAKGQMDPKHIMESAAQCFEIALRRRKQRRSAALKAYKRSPHRAAHLSPPSDPVNFEVRRRLAPEVDGSPQIEAALDNAGFRLRLLEPSFSESLAAPVIVWTREERDYVEVEVYGQPELYASGGSETEALQMLVGLIQFYGEELLESPIPVGGPAARLQNYLATVFRPR